MSYILNPEVLPQNKLFRTNEIIGKYLITHKIPVLSIQGKQYLFSCTDALKLVLQNLPFYLKPLVKIPECFK